MFPGRRHRISFILLTGLCLVSRVSFAVQFEPGVGFGLEYTDNARLTAENQLDDLIAATYVGANVIENDGPLRYDATATFNKHNYTQDSYADQRYFNLGASANWEMIKNRFDWFLTDRFSQRPIISLDSNTPDNLQNTNIFTFGANLDVPAPARHNIRITPMFSQYYYETLLTDNKQYSLAANWNYQMFRLTSVGLNLSIRGIDYSEQAIEDTRFTNLGFIFNGQRQRSTFAVNLGSTAVKRDNGDETSGFSGFLNWLVDLTSRSKFATDISTDLTDTSSVAATAPPGGGNDVQITADVVRNSLVNLAYIREDASLKTTAWMRYNKLTYSDNPLDRVIRAFGIRADYPITGLLSSGAYTTYNRTEQLDTRREDKRYTVGANLRYNFSRKLHGIADLKFRKKDSTTASQSFDESSLFVSLVYGFGDVRRPTRTGGY